MTKQTPAEIEMLGAAARKLCRRFASIIVGMMAETDTSIEVIAERTGRDADDIKERLEDLINGRGARCHLSWLADVAWAMECEIGISLGRTVIEHGNEIVGGSSNETD